MAAAGLADSSPQALSRGTAACPQRGLIGVQAGNQVSGHPSYSASCHEFHLHTSSREPLSLNCAPLFGCALVSCPRSDAPPPDSHESPLPPRRSDRLERSGSNSPTTPRDPPTSSSRRPPAPSLTAQTAVAGRMRRRSASDGDPVRRRVDERAVGRTAAGTRGTVITTRHRDQSPGRICRHPFFSPASRAVALCNGPRVPLPAWHTGGALSASAAGQPGSREAARGRGRRRGGGGGGGGGGAASSSALRRGP